MEIILTHENADFDAVASLLAAYKLNPRARPILPSRLNQNVARFMTLYQNGLPFTRAEDFRAASATSITLVDTQRPPKLRGLPDDLPTKIIDHHQPPGELPPHQTFTGDTVGAATTLLVEQMQAAGIALNSLEATLLILGIYEDTGSLTYGTTTPRDLNAAAWLLAHKATLDTVRQFLTPPLGDEQQALFDVLFRAAERRAIEGYEVTVCTATVDQYITEISSVAHRLRDTLDTAILFVLVEMPESLQLVCRATVDALDVGEIARLFGGGGHNRAAAAAIHDKSLKEVVNALWEAVYRYIQPVTRVSDLMSYGAHTVEANKTVKDVVRQLRRIGHEGYPVVENGQIVGLLTRRDLDRAAEHGLNDAQIREIMSEGQITLKASDSLSTLEQRMVESGWGQIPVVDEGDKLIGIVTRTDLIKHWARIHPPTRQATPSITPNRLLTVFGDDITALINTISQHAQASNTTLYMVGGVVRDLLLNRKNLDIDFVVETDAIEFARKLQQQYGGKLSSFRPFGTAKWILDDTLSAELRKANGLPEHIDFATARNEFYEHPTALPTVYNSSIKLDLARRDFTINTLAIQLSPTSFNGRILDFYGGLNDLNNGIIRVLHSLSFVDDPTRILRAVRFKQRLQFQIEPRTGELIETARPMLGRITGERLRNELTLLLREQNPETGLRDLEQRGILTAIHPAFTLPAQLENWFSGARSFSPPWQAAPYDLVDFYWHLIAISIPSEALAAWSERLMFSQTMQQSMLAARRVVEKADYLSSPETKPSQIAAALKDVPELALLAAWIALEDAAREAIRRYWTDWQHRQPVTNGNTLRERGLKPGPCYSLILTRLRTALLDGEIRTEADEQNLLNSLINEGICDDRT